MSIYLFIFLKFSLNFPTERYHPEQRRMVELKKRQTYDTVETLKKQSLERGLDGRITLNIGKGEQNEKIKSQNKNAEPAKSEEKSLEMSNLQEQSNEGRKQSLKSFGFGKKKMDKKFSETTAQYLGQIYKDYLKEMDNTSEVQQNKDNEKPKINQDNHGRISSKDRTRIQNNQRINNKTAVSNFKDEIDFSPRNSKSFEEIDNVQHSHSRNLKNENKPINTSISKMHDSSPNRHKSSNTGKIIHTSKSLMPLNDIDIKLLKTTSLKSDEKPRQRDKSLEEMRKVSMQVDDAIAVLKAKTCTTKAPIYNEIFSNHAKTLREKRQKYADTGRTGGSVPTNKSASRKLATTVGPEIGNQLMKLVTKTEEFGIEMGAERLPVASVHDEQAVENAISLCADYNNVISVNITGEGAIGGIQEQAEKDASFNNVDGNENPTHSKKKAKRKQKRVARPAEDAGDSIRSDGERWRRKKQHEPSPSQNGYFESRID